MNCEESALSAALSSVIDTEAKLAAARAIASAYLAHRHALSSCTSLAALVQSLGELTGSDGEHGPRAHASAGTHPEEAHSTCAQLLVRLEKAVNDAASVAIILGQCCTDTSTRLLCMRVGQRMKHDACRLRAARLWGEGATGQQS